MDKPIVLEIRNENFRAGFVSILGLPNSGKSTLTNALSGARMAIVSPKPQTTRDHIKSIITGPGYQIVLVDTPGFLQPYNALEKKMARDVDRAMKDDADIICLLAEPETRVLTEKRLFFEKLPLGRKVFLVINKIDAYSPEKAEAAEKFLKEAVPGISSIFRISALNGTNVKNLKEEIVKNLPLSPPYYPDERLSDRWERFFAAEIIRESIFNSYKDEIPYSCAVEIDVFEENEREPSYIHAQIYVSRESHKPIIIGKGGREIKKLRENSEKQMKKFLGRPVKLELFIKVREKWQDDPEFIKRIYRSE